MPCAPQRRACASQAVRNGAARHSGSIRGIPLREPVAGDGAKELLVTGLQLVDDAGSPLEALAQLQLLLRRRVNRGGHLPMPRVYFCIRPGRHLDTKPLAQRHGRARSDHERVSVPLSFRESHQTLEMRGNRQHAFLEGVVCVRAAKVRGPHARPKRREQLCELT